MWMELSKWSQTVKIFVSHVSAHQKTTSAKDNFNNQVDKMTLSVNTTQPLSPATPVITQWTHEQSGHGGRGGGYPWTQQHGLPFTKSNLAMATAECPICQQQRPILSPKYGTIPQSDQPATWWQVDYIGFLPSWKGQWFVLTGRHSRYEFAYRACDASAETTIVDMWNALSTVMVFYTAFPLTKALTLQLEKYSSVLMLMEFTGLTTFRIILEQLD
nr:uncharacterized protein LOC123575474 [Macaca fascicularis]